MLLKGHFRRVSCLPLEVNQRHAPRNIRSASPPITPPIIALIGAGLEAEGCLSVVVVVTRVLEAATKSLDRNKVDEILRRRES
jgi:hypothetical protein